ncbi:response regulator [Sandarakinorhabdus sp. DWP1-3-1]|uniref:response regulator n=1 Tax=Sandarakinorhabdus sp. DWP1-3-1 TaxID=2804627 RepID=UPI003CF57AC1
MVMDPPRRSGVQTLWGRIVILSEGDVASGKDLSTTSTVLLVEDEVLIRAMLADELLDRGYNVICAASGDEAAEVVRSGVPIDIVLSDVRMPGRLDGLGLLEVVTKDRPGLPVVLCSGTLHPAEAINRGARDFVAKPFDMLQITDALERALSRGER